MRTKFPRGKKGSQGDVFEIFQRNTLVQFSFYLTSFFLINITDNCSG